MEKERKKCLTEKRKTLKKNRTKPLMEKERKKMSINLIYDTEFI